MGTLLIKSLHVLYKWNVLLSTYSSHSFRKILGKWLGFAMCPIGQCIQAPTDQVGGVSSRTGKSSLRTPSQKQCIQKHAQHAHRKMALDLCPAQVLNGSFNICISNQGRDADLCSCLKHSSGKDFEAL